MWLPLALVAVILTVYVCHQDWYVQVLYLLALTLALLSYLRWVRPARASRNTMRDRWTLPLATITVDHAIKANTTVDSAAEIRHKILSSPEKHVVLPRCGLPLREGDRTSCITIDPVVSLGKGDAVRLSLETDLTKFLKWDAYRAEWSRLGTKELLKLWPVWQWSAPSLAEFARVLDAIDGNDNLFNVGINMDTGEGVYHDMDKHGPHLLIAAGTGAGKSSFYYWLILQMIRKGHGVVALDAKSVSLLDAVLSFTDTGMHPNVKYIDHPEAIARAIQAMMAESIRRQHANRDAKVDRIPEAQHIKFFRIHLIVEEINSLMQILKRLHDDYQAKNGGPKSKSKTMSDYQMLLFMAREFGIHVHALSQRGEANATGGSAARAQFSTRYMSRWSQSDINMMAPGYKGLKHPGDRSWWQFPVGGEATRFVSPWLKDNPDVDLIRDYRPLAKLENVPELEWTYDVTSIVDIMTAREMTLAGETTFELMPAIDGPADIVEGYRAVSQLLAEHGYAGMSEDTLTGYATGRRGNRRGFGKFPSPVDESRPVKFRRTDLLTWVRNSTVEPDGFMYEGEHLWDSSGRGDGRITKADLELTHYVVYGLMVEGIPYTAYIGHTNDVERRYAEHCADTRQHPEWSEYITGYEVLWEGTCTRIEARKIECDAILARRAPLNVALPSTERGQYNPHRRDFEPLVTA